jgi:chromosome segregation ATPase
MRFYVFALLALVGACKAGATKGQKELEDLSGQIGKLSKQLSEGKDDLKTTMAEHDAIVNNKDGDFVGHFKKFSKGIETVEKDREGIKGQVQKVKDAASPYFTRWKDDNVKITDPGLRERDAKNMEATRARYEEIYKRGDEAKAAYDPLMVTLKNHHQFWSNNLNAESAAQMKGDTEALDKNANTLYGLIDNVVAAAKKYNDSVAMRQKPAPPPPK